MATPTQEQLVEDKNEQENDLQFEFDERELNSPPTTPTKGGQ